MTTRIAGIGWDTDGYVVEVLDEAAASVDSRRFGPDGIADVIGSLINLDHPTVVIDSSLGIVDGRMMAAGLDVYRADPWQLPEGRGLRSAPPMVLARLGVTALDSLQKLERSRGTQTGREHEIDSGMAASAQAIADLTAIGRCLCHGSRDGEKLVALSFDDGPQPPYTGHVLDVLDRYEIPATFFCVGLHASGHPAELRRMHESGHGIGNHTWSHPFLWELSEAQLLAQLDHAADVISGASGGGPPVLFRPPYGSRSPEVVGWLAATQYTVALWDVEPDDWAMPGPEVIAARVLDDARPGSIVVMHDGGGDRSQTVASLPTIIEGFLDGGYRFVRVDDLIAA